MSPPRASSRRSRRPHPLRACGAPAGCSRAEPHPLPIWDRADSGPLAAFSSLHSVGMAGRPIPPSLQSEKRTQRPNLGAIAKPALRSGFAGPRTVLQRPRSAWRLRRPWRCRSGPLLRPAIRGHLARWRAPYDHVSRASRRGPPRQRHADCGLRRGCRSPCGALSRLPAGWVCGSGSIWVICGHPWVMDGKFEIRNPKFEIRSFVHGIITSGGETARPNNARGRRRHP